MREIIKKIGDILEKRLFIKSQSTRNNKRGKRITEVGNINNEETDKKNYIYQ